MIFILLDYNEIHKKQTFNTLDIVQSRVGLLGLLDSLGLLLLFCRTTDTT